MSINDLIANTGQRVAQDGDSLLRTFAYAQQQQRQSVLSGLASKAAGGDKGALNKVAGLDPQTYARLSEGIATMDKSQREALKQGWDILGRAADAADTPEKWASTVDMIGAQAPQVLPFRNRFDMRDMVINQARTVKEMIDSGVHYKDGRVQPLPGSIEAGAAKIGAETAAKEQNSYQSFAPGNMVIPPQGSVLSRLSALAPQQPDGTPAARTAPQVPEVFQGLVSQHAERTGLSPQLVGAVLMRESGGNPNAVSDKGAQGLMQVMPGTAKDPGYGVQPARDTSPEENVRVGTDYLAAMMQKYGGNEKLALAAYNWGPQAVDDWLSSGADPRKVPGETQRYVYKLTGGFVTAPKEGRAQTAMPGQQPQPVQVADASGNLPAGAFVVPDKSKLLTPEEEAQKIRIGKETRPVTNVTVNGEKKGSEKLYNDAAEAFASTQNAARSASRNAVLYDQFSQAIEGFRPGAGADTRLKAGQVLQGLGINAVDGVSEGELARSIGRQLELSAAQSMKGQGQITESERQILREAIPGLSTTLDGNRKIIDMLRRLDSFDMQVAQIYRENAKANGGVVDPVSVAEEVAKLGPAMTATDLNYLKGKSQAATGAPAGVPPMDRRRIGDIYDTPRGKARWMGNGWELLGAQ